MVWKKTNILKKVLIFKPSINKTQINKQGNMRMNAQNNTMIAVGTPMSTNVCATCSSYTYSSEPETVYGVFGGKLK